MLTWISGRRKDVVPRDGSYVTADIRVGVRVVVVDLSENVTTRMDIKILRAQHRRWFQLFQSDRFIPQTVNTPRRAGCASCIPRQPKSTHRSIPNDHLCWSDHFIFLFFQKFMLCNKKGKFLSLKRIVTRRNRITT